MKLRTFLTTAYMLLMMNAAIAQHEHHHHTPGAADRTSAAAMTMSSALLPNLPLQRDGSGTSWHPDASPMHALHRRAGAWQLMYHGAAFLRYTNQDARKSGNRGDAKFDAPNWFMFMAQRPAGEHGQLMFRSMLSLDRLTEGGSGYPLLFQSGETWQGKHLIDRQHPHDLFAELAVAYGRNLGRDAGLFFYFGLPGEPALGPPMFMHRPGAQSNPDAPLSHHWQDATHITFGVATVGLRYKVFKLESSLFTGREPNEKRYDFDKPRFDSKSLRVSMNPNANTAFQISHALIKSPETHAPGVNVRRTTASVLYSAAVGRANNLSTTLAWGMNAARAEEDAHSFLFEAEFALPKQAFYTRIESVQKIGHELAVKEFDERLFRIQAFTLGAARDIFSARALSFRLGAQATTYRFHEDLKPSYGARPLSFELYLHVRPASHD